MGCSEQFVVDVIHTSGRQRNPSPKQLPPKEGAAELIYISILLCVTAPPVIIIITPLAASARMSPLQVPVCGPPQLSTEALGLSISMRMDSLVVWRLACGGCEPAD